MVLSETASVWLHSSLHGSYNLELSALSEGYLAPAGSTDLLIMLQSSNHDSDSDQMVRFEKCFLVVSLCAYIVLSVWLYQYAHSMFKLSRNAYLDMDICGNESVQNMQEFTKINISNFSFLAGALLCKLMVCALMLISVMGLLSKKDTTSSSHFRYVRLLDSVSFVFLLVACSLQLYKWIMIILRVQHFGHGLVN